MNGWLFCQLGAREHFILPRELHRRGLLRALITDAWTAPGSWTAHLPGRMGQRLAERYAAELQSAPVEAFNSGLLGLEAIARLRIKRSDEWGRIIARNLWFERTAARRMRTRKLLEGRPVVFAYSYAALSILREAKAAGCTTVLGQIDPAIVEEDIVSHAVDRFAPLRPSWKRAPPNYWRRWREECALADRIIVNSDWARDALVQAGVHAAKLAVVPLAYEASVAQPKKERPQCFSEERPLKLLFLGSLVIRKGVGELLDAVRILADAPIEFHFVGYEAVRFPADVALHPRVFRYGPAARGAVSAHYSLADVFILPTLSDGFGLTQIEAQAHGLPVIASRRCGEVVREGVDGLLLEQVTGTTISDAVRRYLASPTMLAAHAAAARESVKRFAPGRILDRLLAEVPNCGS